MLDSLLANDFSFPLYEGDPKLLTDSLQHIQKAGAHILNGIGTEVTYVPPNDANDQLATDAYDANGNTTTSNGLGYAYDFENHLVQQACRTIFYDGDGNRVAKNVVNSANQFLVDEENPTGYAQVVDELQSGTVFAGEQFDPDLNL